MTNKSPFYEETIIKLSASPFFSKVTPDILDDILKVFERVTLGKSLILDSDIGMKYFHIILKGRLKITQVNPNTGRSITLFLLEEGDCFDIFPLLDGEEHISQPIVLDDMVMLRAPLENVRLWIDQHPEFNVAFLPYIAKRLRALESFSKDLIFKDTTARLANLILKHTIDEKDKISGYYPVKLINNLSHESLAEMIGTARSVLSTQMHKLKDEGIIIGERGSLFVKNIDKLKDESDEF